MYQLCADASRLREDYKSRFRNSQSALDSGPLSRVYPFAMATFSNRISMQIGEVAKLTALSVDAIRFYERNSLLPKLPRTAGRFRLYSGNDVARLNFIQKMHNLGFSLREVRQVLDIRENRLDPCKEVGLLVKTKVAEIRSKIRGLKKLESDLVGGLRKCDAELRRQNHVPGVCPVLAAAGSEKDRPC